MPRRRSSAREASAWSLQFVEQDWPGRCSLERYRAWSATQRGESGDLAVLSEARRHARRELQHPLNCPVHAGPEYWPTGWSRGAERTTFTVVDSKGNMSSEEVANDSKRDRELRAAFEQWLQRLR